MKNRDLPVALTALVAPSIASIQEHMQAILTITAAVDTAFTANGQAPIFGVDV